MGENHVTSSTNHIQGNWNGHNWNYLKMNGNLFDIFIKATCETEFVIWIYSKYKWNMETVYSEPLKAYLWGVTHETAYSGSKDGSASKFSCLNKRYCFCDRNCKTRACKNWGHQRVTLSKCARLSKQGKVFLTPSRSSVSEVMNIRRLCGAWLGVPWTTPYIPAVGASRYSVMRLTVGSLQTLMWKPAYLKLLLCVWIWILSIKRTLMEISMECLWMTRMVKKRWKLKGTEPHKRLCLLT